MSYKHVVDEEEVMDFLVPFCEVLEQTEADPFVVYVSICHLKKELEKQLGITEEKDND
jgi:hypothetical protein